MLFWIYFISSLITLLEVVIAVGISSDVGAACLFTMNDFNLYPFECLNKDLDYKCRCSNNAFIGSVLLCIEANSQNYDQLTKGYNYIKDVCSLQAKKSFSFLQLVEIFENSTGSSIPLETVDQDSLIQNPIQVDKRRYSLALKSVDDLLRHRMQSTRYGAILLCYWGLVVLVGIISNIISWCAPFWKMKVDGTFTGWVRRHLIIPHLIGLNLNQPNLGPTKRQLYKMGKILPSRIESLVILLYLSLILIFSSINYGIKKSLQNMIFPDVKRQTLVYLADRCGIIAILQVPLLFGFAGRNNILIYLTGWNYRNFNRFHRLISRIVWVMILIHAALYVSFALLNEDYKERWALQKWRWANIATISSGFALLLSCHPIRRRCYEFFKSSHQLLALIFLVGAWQHCKTLGWMEPLYVSVAIWGFDHLLRVVKIIISGGVVKAKCELIVDPRSANLEDVHSIRITINHSGAWRCFPGCYIYLYFLKATMFWESHPFTLLEPTKIENANQLVMLVKIKNGLTKRLGEYLKNKPMRTLILPVLVEGPYGTPIPFRSYENAVFIAGGIGITVVYTFAMDLIRQYKAELSRNEGDRRIHILWVTTNVENVECFANEITALNDTMFVTVSIFVTRDIEYIPPPLVLLEQFNGETEMNFSAARDDEDQSKRNSVISDDDGSEKEIETQQLTGDLIYNMLMAAASAVIPQESTANSDISQRQQLTNNIFNRKLPMVKVEFARPDLSRLLRRQVNSTIGTLAIVSCGPDRLTRDVRRVAAESVDIPMNSRIDYFEEQLLW